MTNVIGIIVAGLLIIAASAFILQNQDVAVACVYAAGVVILCIFGWLIYSSETGERAGLTAAHIGLARELDSSAFQYAPTRGLEGTRDAIAGRLDRRPDDAELMITSGGIEALELVAKSFLDKGDAVVVEAPTYLGAIMAFLSFEADSHSAPGLRLLDQRRLPRLHPRFAEAP